MIPDSISNVTEHTLVKTISPFIIAFLIAASGWMFSSITDLQNRMTLLNEGTVLTIGKEVEDIKEKIHSINQTLTDVRIKIGSIPTHPVHNQ